MAGSAELSFFSEERTIVYHKEHTHGRFVNCYRRQCLRLLKIRDGIADFEAFQAYNCTNITATYFINTAVGNALKSVKLFNLFLFHRSITMANGNLHTVFQRTSVYSSYRNTASIVTVIKRCDKHLRLTIYVLWRRYGLKNLV